MTSIDVQVQAIQKLRRHITAQSGCHRVVLHHTMKCLHVICNVDRQAMIAGRIAIGLRLLYMAAAAAA